jgi:hypothetical protein
MATSWVGLMMLKCHLAAPQAHMCSVLLRWQRLSCIDVTLIHDFHAAVMMIAAPEVAMAEL